MQTQTERNGWRVRLPYELRQQVRIQAARDEQTLEQWVAEAVERRLNHANEVWLATATGANMTQPRYMRARRYPAVDEEKCGDVLSAGTTLRCRLVAGHVGSHSL